jgi:predicted DNA-binding transcriptional regulator AlpA
MVTQKFQTSELHQINLQTLQEVADWAKVSTKTVYRLISDKQIPQFGLGTGLTVFQKKPASPISSKSYMSIWLNNLN